MNYADRMEIRTFHIPADAIDMGLGNIHWIVNRVTWDGQWLGNIANGWSTTQAEAVRTAELYAAAIRPELYAQWVDPGCSDTLAEYIVDAAMKSTIHKSAVHPSPRGF